MPLPADLLQRARDVLAFAPAAGRRCVRDQARFAALSMLDGTPVLILRLKPQGEATHEFSVRMVGGVVHATQLDRTLASSDHFLDRETRMLSAMLAWAAPTLADAPVEAAMPLDQRVDVAGLRELIGLVALGPARGDVAGILNQLTARIQAEEDFTNDWLGAELCVVLRDFGLLSHFDWNTDEIQDSLAILHERIGIDGTFFCTVEDDPDGLATALAEYDRWVRGRGYAVILPESGMDSTFVVVVQRNTARRALELFELFGAAAATLDRLEGPVRRFLNRLRRIDDRT